MTAREKLQEVSIDEEIMLLDEELYVDSFVGVVMLPGLRAVYDFNKMVEELMQKKGLSAEEAEDYVSYNEVRGCSYLGDKAPIIFDPFEY